MKKEKFCVLLFAMCLCAISEAKAVTYTFSCGNNVMCTLNTSTGILTASGNGSISNIPDNYKSNIKTAIIEDGVTSIGNSAFSGASRLTNVNIPNSVTSIGDSAFAKAVSLTNVNIPNSVTSIGDYAFRNALSLTNVNIPNSVTIIGDSAFANALSLTSITIPDSVISIGDNAFGNTNPSELVISEQNLQRYLAASGGFQDTGDLEIDCTSGNCTGLLRAWDEAHGTDYATRSQRETVVTNSDGSESIYDASGNLLGFKNKRSYTPAEAAQVAGEDNTIILYYR